MTIKKHLCLPAVLLAALSTLAFTACSSDDNEEDGGSVTSGKVPSPVLTDQNGNKLRVTKVGEVGFSYDENGKLASFGWTNNMYTINGDAFEVKESYEEGGYTQMAELKIAINSQGLISRISIAGDEKSADGSYSKNTGIMNYQYDGACQLVSASGSTNSEQYSKSSGKRYTGRTSGSYRLTWSNGNIDKVVMESTTSSTGDGQSYNRKEHSTTTYTYGSQPNVFRQMPYYMGEDILSEGLSFFCVTGLYGVGPATLPTECTVVETENDEERGTRSDKIVFTLNPNGSIATEKRVYHGSLLTYQYDMTRAATGQLTGASMPILKDIQKCMKFFKNSDWTRK